EIEKHRAPAQILSVQAEPGAIGDIVERAVAIVAIQGRGIVGKISLENVQLAVAIEIGDGGTHAGLRAAVFIEGRSGGDGNVGEGSIAIVVIQNAGSAVASDKNIRPAIVVKIQSGDAKRIVPGGLIDVGFLGDVFKRAVAAIVIQNIF